MNGWVPLNSAGEDAVRDGLLSHRQLTTTWRSPLAVVSVNLVSDVLRGLLARTGRPRKRTSGPSPIPRQRRSRAGEVLDEVVAKARPARTAARARALGAPYVRRPVPGARPSQVHARSRARPRNDAVR